MNFDALVQAISDIHRRTQSGARRAVNMAKKLNIKMVCVVENMAELQCPHCGKAIDVFGSGGGEKMADEMEADFLGRIPMDLAARKGGDAGQPVVIGYPDSAITRAFITIAGNVQKRFG